MKIERKHPALDRIIDSSAHLEQLEVGFAATEGPVWSWRNNCLYFTDFPNNRIHTWDAKTGLSIFREPSYKANGLTIDHEGRLLACEHVGRRVSRTESGGSLMGIAKHWKGDRLNSPNDIVVKSDGSIYFTDPPFGIRNNFSGAIAPQELSVAGVWRIAPQNNELTLVADDFVTPNGLAFSPDESVLYINDTRQAHIRAFDVQKAGSLANGRLFAHLTGDGPGGADGMKVDREGNIYCSGPGGIHIFDNKATLLGRVTMGHVTNLAWGDQDWSSFYITGDDKLSRLRMMISGIPVGQPKTMYR